MALNIKHLRELIRTHPNSREAARHPSKLPSLSFALAIGARLFGVLDLVNGHRVELQKSGILGHYSVQGDHPLRLGLYRTSKM